MLNLLSKVYTKWGYHWIIPASCLIRLVFLCFFFSNVWFDAQKIHGKVVCWAIFDEGFLHQSLLKHTILLWWAIKFVFWNCQARRQNWKLLKGSARKKFANFIILSEYRNRRDQIEKKSFMQSRPKSKTDIWVNWQLLIETQYFFQIFCLKLALCFLSAYAF